MRSLFFFSPHTQKMLVHLRSTPTLLVYLPLSNATLGKLCLAATGQARRCGVTRGKEGRRGEREVERGACHGEGSQRAGGEQRCLRDDCRSSRWSKPFSLTYTPGFTQTENREWKWGQGGADGCRALAWVTTGDLLPSCLPVCLNADLCHPLQTRDCFLTKYKHKQEHMHGHTDTDKTHTYKNTHALKPAKEKRGGTKDRQCPLVFSSKRNQTKSTNHHP